MRNYRKAKPGEEIVDYDPDDFGLQPPDIISVLGTAHVRGEKAIKAFPLTPDSPSLIYLRGHYHIGDTLHNHYHGVEAVYTPIDKHDVDAFYMRLLSRPPSSVNLIEVLLEEDSSDLVAQYNSVLHVFYSIDYKLMGKTDFCFYFFTEYLSNLYKFRQTFIRKMFRLLGKEIYDKPDDPHVILYLKLRSYTTGSSTYKDTVLKVILGIALIHRLYQKYCSSTSLRISASPYKIGGLRGAIDLIDLDYYDLPPEKAEKIPPAEIPADDSEI